MSTKKSNEPITLVYKHVGDLTLHLDLYPPISSLDQPRPALVYFHAGGLTVGDRTSWFPHWLHERLTTSGMAFISADYRLIPPSNGHDALEDVVDLISYVAEGLSPDLASYGLHLQINASRIAVAGTSAGGMCAYLAAIHASPRPKALLSMYGMGGDWLDQHMYSIKREPFFMGYEILDPTSFSDFFYPASVLIPPLSGSPLKYHPPDSATPGYPANPRMQLARVYIQEGVLMDYWTGIHEPSFSARMRTLLPDNDASIMQNAQTARDKMIAAIPDSARPLFPQLHVSSAWPPSFFVHGERDSAVHAHESSYLHGLLVGAGVRTELRVVEAEEHSFDYKSGADEKFGGEGGLYDQVVEFLREELCS